MDELDQEIEEELAWLKKHAGGWENLANILYRFVPDQLEVFDRVIAMKAFRHEARGKKKDYTFEQLFDWNKRVEKHSKEYDCSKAKACRTLVRKGEIKLEKSGNHQFGDLDAKNLDRKLQDFRADEKKRIARRRGRAPSSVMEAILQDETEPTVNDDNP